MKSEAILDYYIFNQNVYPTNKTEIFDEIESPLIYEVIRVIDGIPLYVEEHIVRMRKSSKLMGYEIDVTDEEIMSQIMKLISVNDYKNFNIKLICSNLESKEEIFLIYYIESHYPEDEVYKRGIHTILLNSERENPNAKVVNTDLRQRANEKIKKAEAYEALLVNQKGYITEGSRSNIFFVSNAKIYTAPPGDVLLGVTRDHIMEICSELNIEVIEKHVHVEDLTKIDAAFMTGTSVKVLPITTIDDTQYNSVENSVIKRISEEFNKDVDKYIKTQKNREQVI